MRKKYCIEGLILITVCFIAGCQWSQAQTTESWNASEQTVERLSKNQTDFNYYEEKVPAYTLPELLKTGGGKKVSNQKTWTKVRRNEILELFRTEVFGRVPQTDYKTNFRVVNLDKNAAGGNATLKQVDISIITEEKELVIHLILFTPNKVTAPVPVFLLINNRGPANTDPSREVKSEFWPVEEVIARGYGMAVFSNADVDPDNFVNFKNGIHPMLDKGSRHPYSWGTIAAWAWGASRCSSQGALCGLCQRRPLGRSARIIPCTLPFLTGFSAYRNRQQNT